MSRREQIEAMLIDTPDDIFLRYALAMELNNDEEHEASLKIYDELTQGSPPYVPAFFMAGQQLAALERYDDARTVLRNGIDQARAQDDLHAAAEMSEFLASLGQFGEN